MNGWSFDWVVSMVIWITTKILSPVPFVTPVPSIKFHHDLFILAMLPTDSQTERQISKQMLSKT